MPEDSGYVFSENLLTILLRGHDPVSGGAGNPHALKCIPRGATKLRSGRHRLMASRYRSSTGSEHCIGMSGFFCYIRGRESISSLASVAF